MVIGRNTCNEGDASKPVPGTSDQRIPVRIRVPEKPIQQPSEQASVPRGFGLKERTSTDMDILRVARDATE